MRIQQYMTETGEYELRSLVSNAYILMSTPTQMKRLMNRLLLQKGLSEHSNIVVGDHAAELERYCPRNKVIRNDFLGSATIISV